ncbi:MAG: hypothetical protein QM811_07535, partial [Pirellulales bacterium]
LLRLIGKHDRIRTAPLFHPTTTEYGGERAQMEALLDAIFAIRRPTLLLWPNIDAGSDHIGKAIRTYRDQRRPDWLRTLTNFTPENYLKVLANTACAVGEFEQVRPRRRLLRYADRAGLGNRQEGGEHDVHVTPVAPVASDIEAAIRKELEHGRYFDEHAVRRRSRGESDRGKRGRSGAVCAEATQLHL